MKTAFLVLLFSLAVAFASNAQTQKGTKMLGGSGFVLLDEGIDIYLVPNAGYFIADDVAVGGGVELYYARYDPFRYMAVGLQPFVRYYFGPPTARTRYFAQVNGAVSYRNDKNMDAVEDISHNYTSNSVGAGLGVVYFLTEQVGAEARLFYENEKYNAGPRNGRLGLRFGVQIHLPGSAE
ncbi:hypothetical protein ACFS7Z_18770 [Pontibacter toksunensis]|uniref:Outer membrane protein beta-barrel domain-containing protein n=1 Tax=Pontibacter toksunensis TaxID=1332631 RepID=A0ABW6BZS8_9BACT